MEMTSDLFLDLWEKVKDMPSTKAKKDDLAVLLLAVFDDHGIQETEMMKIEGEDDHIDHALEAAYVDEHEDNVGFAEYDHDEEDEVYD